MPLTPAQNTTFKAHIAANVNTVPAGMPWTNGFAGQAINTLPNDNAGNTTAAGWYNQTASPTFTVWRDIPMDTVLGLITNASMTPADAVPPAPTTLPAAPSEADQAAYSNQMAALEVWKVRSIACQGKQFNLQNLILSRITAPMKKTSYRASLQDCLTNIPAGVGGANIAANWTGVRDAAKSSARYVEQVFATGTGSVVVPADLGYEGSITGDDVETARNSA